MKKTIALILSAVMLVCALASCGGGEGGAAASAKVQNIFLSPAQLTYRNMRPEYNYYLTSYAMEELTINDDGTYCLQLMSSTFSALELAESTQDAKGNERMNQVVKLYGTCTTKPNDLDDDLVDITLSAPTRAVVSYDQSYWLDTDNWTEAMGLKVRPASGYDDNGNPIVDKDAPAVAAADYLRTFAFQGGDIQGNVKTASFDYFDLGISVVM